MMIGLGSMFITINLQRLGFQINTWTPKRQILIQRLIKIKKNKKIKNKRKEKKERKTIELGLHQFFKDNMFD